MIGRRVTTSSASSQRAPFFRTATTARQRHPRRHTAIRYRRLRFSDKKKRNSTTIGIERSNRNWRGKNTARQHEVGRDVNAARQLLVVCGPSNTALVVVVVVVDKRTRSRRTRSGGLCVGFTDIARLQTAVARPPTQWPVSRWCQNTDDDDDEASDGQLTMTSSTLETSASTIRSPNTLIPSSHHKRQL